MVGTPVTYSVIAGPSNLVGKEIHVMIDCVEMPRGSTPERYGDLEKFEVGAKHFLALRLGNIRHIDYPNKLPKDGIWFYLRAASLKELRPNSSGAKAPNR